VNTSLFERLHSEGLISDTSLQRVKRASETRHFSVYWELKILLYTGVLLLTTGIGILIYKNIDTIGHQVILALIAALCAGCFYYCEKKKLPFSHEKVGSPNSYFDYILLLGCITMLTFLAYLQAQYTVFGDKYGLATFIPMIILFFCAYYFDHLGVLTMAVTNLAAWLGLAVTPLNILKSNNFANTEIIFAGLALGVFLVALSYFTETKKIKTHFSFTYLNFGLNILFIATLAGMFKFDNFYIAWLIPLGIIAFYFYKKALALSSFYIILLVVLYTYVGLSYVVVRLLFEYFFTLVYFIASAIGIVVLLISLNQKLKTNARLRQ
jgi:hypothetical protein